MTRGNLWVKSLLILATLIIPSFAQVVVPILATTAVTEGDSVEVCLELFDRSLITGTASVSLITVNPPTSSTVKSTDYVELQRNYRFTESSPRRQCVILETLRDHAIEDTETITISLANNISINIGPPIHLSINPAPDKLVVGFVETSYTTNEEQKMTNISIQLVEGAIETAFPSVVEVQLGTIDVSTEGSKDYRLMASIEFSADDHEGSIKQAQVAIQDDLEVEGPEIVHITIMNSSNIFATNLQTRNTGLTSLVILDNDIASVSLLGTRLVSVVEDDEENLGSNVEICVKLILSTDIPIERSVVVLLDIKDISTDESDYRLKNTTLTFLPGSESLSTTCTNLSIVADKLEEINETAILCISPTEPDVLHEDSLLNITVNIINNDVNCPAIAPPPYPSSINMTGGVIEGATITYSCAPGYHVLGDSQHQCISGVWSGKEPTCRVLDCGEPPLLENGDYSLANTTVNSTAVYFCQVGYHEKLGQSNKIRCLDNGHWSQLDMQCIKLEIDKERNRLGGGGVAAIVVGSLLIVGVPVGVVLVLGLWYYNCHYRTGTKRSGKYVVDNSGIQDDHEEKESMSLAVRPYSTVSEDDNFLGGSNTLAVCSPIDV